MAADYDFVRPYLTQLWGGEPDSLQLVREGANVVFRFTTGGYGRYLRITSIWERKKVISALAYLDYLARQGAPVCAPVASVNGRLLEDIRHNGITYMARVYEEAEGETLTNRCTDPTIYRAWGQAIALLHKAAATYQPDPDLYFFSAEKEWQDTAVWLPEDDTAAWTEFERIDAWRRNLPSLPTGFGVTHADCNAGNFVWNGRTITIIDFDEPMLTWFAADIARPFLEIYDFPLALRRELLAAFLAGYGAVRPLDEATIVSLPWFMRMKDIAVYAWELSEGVPFDAPHIREYRRRFVRPLCW